MPFRAIFKQGELGKGNNGSLLKISLHRWVLSSIQHLWVWVRKIMLTAQCHPWASLGHCGRHPGFYTVQCHLLIAKDKISETFRYTRNLKLKPHDTKGHWSCSSINTQMLKQDQTLVHTPWWAAKHNHGGKAGTCPSTSRKGKRHPWKVKKTSCSSLPDWIHLNYKCTAKYILPRTSSSFLNCSFYHSNLGGNFRSSFHLITQWLLHSAILY